MERRSLFTRHPPPADSRSFWSPCLFFLPSAVRTQLSAMVNWKVLGILGLVIGSLGIVISGVLYATTGGNVPFDFGVVLDAGSSHTGITLYRWCGAKEQSTGLVKEELYTEFRNAGIASYPDPKLIANVLVLLTQTATKKVPDGQKASTPVYLGATAGMRLLEEENSTASELTLKTIRETFANKSGLDIKTMSIISGQDEGLFAWVTANYLLNRLTHSVDGKDETVATLDMGGASAQIAFAVNASDPETQTLRLYGREHNVTSSSNLCYGTDQARLRHFALLIGKSGTKFMDPCLPPNATVEIGGNEFARSPCLITKIHARIPFDPSENYTFTGYGNGSLCSSLIAKQLTNNTFCEDTIQFKHCADPKTVLSDQMDVIAISSYYLTANVLGLQDHKINKSQFIAATKHLCSLSHEKVIREYKKITIKYSNLYCFQLNYIYHTLVDLYKLPGNWDNLRFQDQVNGATLGWSLGYMVNATNAIPEEKPSEPVLDTAPFVVIIIICWLLFIIGIAFLVKSIREQRASRSSDAYQPIQQPA